MQKKMSPLNANELHHVIGGAAASATTSTSDVQSTLSNAASTCAAMDANALATGTKVPNSNITLLNTPAAQAWNQRATSCWDSYRKLNNELNGGKVSFPLVKK